MKPIVTDNSMSIVPFIVLVALAGLSFAADVRKGGKEGRSTLDVWSRPGAVLTRTNILVILAIAYYVLGNLNEIV